jgi:hypothetical protein
MEPLRDDELEVLLREGEPRWRPSAGLDARVREAQRPRPWEWLWQGSVRVPVPVALAVLAVLGLLAWNRVPEAKRVDQFQPVKQLEIKLVRSGDAN